MAIIADMNKPSITRRGQGLVALALVSSAPFALADNLTWVAGDGAWENAANWSGAALPGVDDFVDISHLGNVTSSASANLAKELLNKSALGIGAGKLAVTGTVDTFGAVTVDGGATLDAGRITIESGGALHVDGTGSTVTVVQGVFNYGDWQMDVGGTLSAESFDNFAGFGIDRGAQATANSMINHGGSSVVVSDTNSALIIHGSLTNDSAITIFSGARVEANSIDNNELMRVVDSSLITGSMKNVSNAGSHSTLRIEGGDAHFTATDLVTNDFSIEVDGGHANIAHLDNNGTVIFSSGHLDGEDVSSTNQISFDGASVATLSGQILNSGVMTISASSTVRASKFQQSAGDTQLQGGTLGATDAFGVQFAGGELRGNGSIDGRLVLSASGVLTPGDANDETGEFDVAAGLDLLGGTFAVDLGGTARADYDVLDVHGAAHLGGTLKVSLLSGFVPVLGDAFDIILADSISGAFGAMLLPTLGDGLKFTTINTGSFFRLQVAAVPLPAPALLLGGALGVLGWASRRRA